MKLIVQNRYWILTIVVIVAMVFLVLNFAPGRLEVKTNFEGAKLTVSGQEYTLNSKTKSIWLTKGYHNVSLEKDGFEKIELTANVRPILKKTFELDLSRMRFEEEVFGGYGEDPNFMILSSGKTFLAVEPIKNYFVVLRFNESDGKFTREDRRIDFGFNESEILLNAAVNQNGEWLLVTSSDNSNNDLFKTRLVSIEQNRVTDSADFAQAVWMDKTKIATVDSGQIKFFNGNLDSPTSTVNMPEENCSLTGDGSVYLTCPQEGKNYRVSEDGLAPLEISGIIELVKARDTQTFISASLPDQNKYYLASNTGIKEISLDNLSIYQLEFIDENNIVAFGAKDGSYGFLEVSLKDQTLQTIELYNYDNPQISAFQIIGQKLLFADYGNLYSLNINEK